MGKPMRLRITATTTAGAAAAALLSLHCGPIGSTGATTPAPDASTTEAGGSSGGTAASDAGAMQTPAQPDASGTDDSGTTAGDGGASSSTLHVAGNHFVDNGKTVRLLGVDHSGTEYQCIGGSNIFEGPTDDNLLSAMSAWNINTVRVPLNEDCWLGINGVATDVGGSSYQAAIASYVQLLRGSGRYVILDLHWNAPGSTLAKSQQPMPDADHAEDFWKSVATTFQGDMGVLFDLYNEPYPDKGTSDPGACLLNGCTLSDWTGFTGTAKAVGMAQLLSDVRGTGAKNVVLIGGWSYASQLGQWLTYAPTDPLKNLAASFHTYNFTGCNDAACWNSTIKPVAAQVPVVTGELGENDCGESYIDSYFAWADPLGISYLGWAWNVQDCSKFPALISSYSGTPTAFGQGFLTHLPTQ
jgi:hypothetical protein